MNAEFEEKEYENPLIQQLMLRSNGLMWTPGQVFEGRFGVDAALEVLDCELWKKFGFQGRLGGVVLNDYYRGVPSKDKFPDFSLNLFIQVKRSEVLRRRCDSKLKELGLKIPYWRFKIKAHQQKLLFKLKRKLNNKAFVVYASPAFDLRNDLFGHIRTCSLVENSTFVRVDKLEGHNKWVYDCPGYKGIACSIPEYIEDVNLFDDIEKTVQSQKSIVSNDDNNALSFLYEKLLELMKEEENSNFLAKEGLNRWSEIEELEVEDVVKYYYLINVFTSITSTNWFVLG